MGLFVEREIEADSELANNAMDQPCALENFMWAAPTVPDDTLKGLRVRAGEVADLLIIDRHQDWRIVVLQRQLGADFDVESFLPPQADERR